MGITEPCLYGVLLRLKKPLIASMIGGGIGGIYAGISGLVRYAFVSPGLAALPAFIGANPMNIVHAVITCIISFAAAFAAAWVLGFDEPADPGQAKKETKPSEKPGSKAAAVSAPVSGICIPLSEVNDAVFSQKILGDGAAIIPSEGKVYAPVNGTVSTVFDTKHAIGLLSEDGVELLIHIGIDTVNLEGKYFTAHVESGQKIRKGDLLVSFDQEMIQKVGYDTVTPVLITNTAEFHSIHTDASGNVKAGDVLLTVR